MKSISAIISAFLENRMTRINLKTLAKLLVVFIALIATYSVLFHLLMMREGQQHSWFTGVYWTLTVMSTLGFGDITFESDLGRFFSVVVLMTGTLFLLVLLPFTFIEFFYAPFMKAQEKAGAPTQVPENMEGHVIITDYGPIARMLTDLLSKYGYQYFILTSKLELALTLQDQGIPVVLGNWAEPESFEKLGIERARMLVTTRNDIANTNTTFTAREISDSVTIVASATSSSVRDALELAGVTHILQMDELMGKALARRVIGNDDKAHVIGKVDGLFIAETAVAHTDFSGKTIADSGINEQTGLAVVGRWDRGQYLPTDLDTPIHQNSILLLAGTEEQIQTYNDTYGAIERTISKVVIVGGGRVGRALSCSLSEAGIEWVIIEKKHERVKGIENTVIGDATDFDTLVKAGVQEATSVIITSHDDLLNIFLTIYCRRLRNTLQIIARCTRARNAPRLHRAGADLALSYASIGAHKIFNYLQGGSTVLLTDGVIVFTVKVPSQLAGLSIGVSETRSKFGCSIIALEVSGKRQINPGPEQLLPEDGTLVLIGTFEAERQFLAYFGSN